MKKSTLALLGLTTLGLLGCAYAPSSQEITTLLKESFTERGVAKLDRLNQTELQLICSQQAESDKALDETGREKMEKQFRENIPYPQDGVYLGNWQEGEKIAQNGRGLQFTDPAGSTNGANCYACHQLSPREISFGNQGPSLLKYGVLRGVTNPQAKESEAVVKYTWARIWNGHAFNLCNGMPRYGDSGILTTSQIKDVMALLLDPESPVNK